MRRVDLGRFSPEHLPLFQQAAIDARADFNALIDSLYPADSDPASLLAGPLSRSPYVSSLFLDCCRLRFVERLLAGEGVDEIVTDSPVLREVLARRFRDDGLPTRAILRTTFGKRLFRRVRPFVRAAKAALRFARESLAARGGRRPLPPEPLTLLDTFLAEGSFRDGAYRDRYYPGLLDALTTEERSLVRYLPEFPAGEDGAALTAKALKSGAPFLIKGAYLRPSDYLAALLSPLKTSAPNASPCFGRWNAGPLVRADRRETAWNEMSLAGVLNYRFARRLREAGARVRLVVDWSENQILDRGLVLGFRAAYPGVPIVGYCGYIIAPEQHVYSRPTPRERAADLVPDRLVVVGPALEDGAREFDPSLLVSTGPAFRFAGVWRQRPHRSPSEATTVLLALPISYEGALDILALAACAAPRLPGVVFAVKAHPMTTARELTRRFEVEHGAWPAAFEFASGDFTDVVGRVDVLAGNTSSTCVEALAQGVPVLIVGNPRGITEDPIPPGLAPEMRRAVFTAEEFARAVVDLAVKDAASLARYAETGRGVRAACFTPVDEDGVRRLLQLERKKT